LAKNSRLVGEIEAELTAAQEQSQRCSAAIWMGRERQSG
jgi:hypothetical protein